MNRNVLLLLSAFFVSIASNGQTQFSITQINPVTNTNISTYQSLEITLNGISGGKPAVSVFGRYAGAYSTAGRGNLAVLRNALTFSPSYGFHPNEQLQLSAGAEISSGQGLPVSNPKVFNYRVQSSATGTGAFVDSLTVPTNTFAAGALFQLADMNNDNQIDIVECAAEGALSYYANYGSSFEQNSITKVSTGPLFMHVADLYEDGYPDVVLISNKARAVYIHENIAGQISPNPQTYTMEVFPSDSYQDDFAPISGDADGDGDLDLLIPQGSFLALLLNEPARKTFLLSTLKTTNGGGNSPCFIDVDNDGDLDIVSQGATISTNDGKGNFTALNTKSVSIISSEELDFDNDGDIDLAQLLDGGKALQLQLLINDKGAYNLYKTINVAKTSSVATSLYSGDYNGDGWLDLGFFVGEPSYDNKFEFLYNDSKGNYSELTKYSVGRLNNYSATADMDGDGDLDFIGLVNEAASREKYYNIYYNGIPCSQPLVVNSTDDMSRVAGCGTLRFAIGHANQTEEVDEITFDLPKGSAIQLQSELSITRSVKIIGPGADLLSLSVESGAVLNFNTPNFIVNPRLEAIGDTSLVSNITIEKSPNAIKFSNPGENLILKNCVIKNNTNFNGFASGLYFDAANLLMESCTFSDNTVLGGQGASGAAAFVKPDGVAYIRNSTFENNRGQNAAGGTSGTGNALFVTGYGMTAVVEGCTFTNNRSVNGGAVSLESPNGKDSLAIINSTFSGNKALSNGAAIYMTGSGSRLFIQNVTMTENGDSLIVEELDGKPTPFYPSGGGLGIIQGNVYLSNTIIANNEASNAQDIYNYFGNIISQGGNLIGITGDHGSTITFLKSDLTGTGKLPLDPLLGSLMDNGGPTQTHLPSEGSPVIDKGIKNNLKLDQKGDIRVSGAGVDIGSVEYVGLPTVFSGKDTTVCSTSVTLKATSIPASLNGYRGFWKNLDAKARGTFSDSTKFNSTAKLTYGTNKFSWTITDGQFIKTDTVVITSYYLAQRANAGIDKTVFRDTLTLVGNLPTTALTTISWKVLLGTATLKDSTKYTTLASKLSQGVNRFEYRFGTAPCVTRDTAFITYVRLDSANAGTNITTCTDTARLAADVPGRGYTGKWRILKGLLQLNADSVYNAKVSNVVDSVSTLIWTVTHLATKKATSDTLTVFGISVKVKVTRPDTLDNVFVTNRSISLDAKVSGQRSTLWYLNNVPLPATVPVKTTVTITADTNVFKIRATNGQCVAWDSVMVYFIDSTRAFAGTDQLICTDSMLLSALKPATGYTGRWTVLSGSAVVVQDSVFNSKVKNLGLTRTRQDVLIWSIYQTGRLRSRDTVILLQQTRPIVTATSGGSYCANVSDIPLSGTVLYATGGRWSGAAKIIAPDSLNTSFKPTSTETAKDSIRLFFSSTGNGKCPATSDTIVFHFMPVPTVDFGKDTAFSTCKSRGTMITFPAVDSLPLSRQSYYWEALESVGGQSIRSQVSISPNNQFQIDSLYFFKTRFKLTLFNGNCSASDTLAFYHLRVINVQTDTIEVIAGKDVIYNVLENDLKTKLERLTLLTVSNGSLSPILSASILPPDSVSVLFKTNPLIIKDDNSTTYRVHNQCGVSATGTIIVRALNSVPVALTKDSVISVGKVFVQSFPAKDLDINQNISTVSVPSLSSGAIASYTFDSTTNTYTFRVDYSAVPNFHQLERVAFQICDLGGACSDLVFNIDVRTGVTVYQALSPNGDGKNDVVQIDLIEEYPDNEFRVFNRWGDRVYHASGYNGKDVAFDGKELPDGTYYYVLELGDGSKALEGFIVLKR